jgi:integrase
MGSIKGVTQKNGYWYARIDGKQVYCGKGDKGFNMAKAARQKWEVEQYENREVNAGLRVKKIHLKNVKELSNWYMTLPSIVKQKSYVRKVIGVKHLVDYFGNKPLSSIRVSEQEKYRQYRSNNGAASGTIDLELTYLSAMYNEAIQDELIPANFKPGKFLREKEKIPRRTITDAEYELLLNHAKVDFLKMFLCVPMKQL